MAKVSPRKQVGQRTTSTKPSSPASSTASSSPSEDSSSAGSQYSQTSTDSDSSHTSDHGKHEMTQTRAPIRSSTKQPTDWKKYHRRDPSKPPIGSNKKTNEHAPVSRGQASKASSRPSQPSPGESSHGGASASRSEGISTVVCNGTGSVCETESAVDEVSGIFGDALGRAEEVFRRQIDTERQARREAERQVAEEKKENERLQRANSELEGKLEACERKNEELLEKQEELNTWKEEKKKAVDELACCRKKELASSKIIEDQGRSLAEKEDENSQLRSETENQKRLLSEKADENSQLRSETENQKRLLSEKEDENSQLRSETENQKRLLSEKADENSQLRSETENQKRLLSEKEDENAQLRSETERAKQERKDAEESYNKASEDRSALFGENIALSTTINEAQKALNTAETEVKQLTQEKQSQETAIAKLRQDLGNVYDARQVDFRKISTLESECRRLHELNQNLTRDNESFQWNTCLLSLLLQYTRRLLIDEKARSTQLRTEGKTLFAILDEVAERQMEFAIANERLETVNSEYQDRIKALQTWLIRLKMRLDRSKKKPSHANYFPSKPEGSWKSTHKEDDERKKGRKRLAWMRRSLLDLAFAQIENGHVREIHWRHGKRRKKTT